MEKIDCESMAGLSDRLLGIAVGSCMRAQIPTPSIPILIQFRSHDSILIECHRPYDASASDLSCIIISVSDIASILRPWIFV